MAKYKCIMCGYIYDDDKEDIKFEDLPEDWVCPMCFSPKSDFQKITEDNNKKEETKISKANNTFKKEESTTTVENYLKEYARVSDDIEKNMDDIHKMAITGESIISAMGPNIKPIGFDDILILGGQLYNPPLLESDPVNLKTIIGKNAKKPLEISMPVIISHMSFGALSKEAKTALSIGSSRVKTAICGGEGGILEEEFDNAYKYIFEYVPNKYSVNDENLKKVAAIEIKIGQGTKPGMGGHLPGAKVTPEIARIRGKNIGEDIISPSRFTEINTKEDLKDLVSMLREKSEGRPIGIKLAAGHIEKDLEFATYANPDFITIDGRGGATGASPKIIKNATTVPTIYALYRARKYLDEHNIKDISLIITGGLRTSADFAKAIAMGADAIAIATSALMAIACSQYRICQSGMCPVGVATQDDNLRSRLKVDLSAKRLENFLNVVKDELKTFARITGKDDIHKLDVEDITTTNHEISDYTNIKHV